MPRGMLLAVALVVSAPTTQSLTLELRIFSGTEEVTAESRVTVQKAGERGEPVAQLPPGSSRVEIEVPAGIYDIQAIREREGRVVTIRWAERLVVMPYPDEGGRHLEVVNFENGFGALQVRAADRSRPDVGLYATGERQKEAALRVEGSDYVLFIVPAGRYDLQVRTSGGPTWHTNIEVPLERTRLWLLP